MRRFGCTLQILKAFFFDSILFLYTTSRGLTVRLWFGGPKTATTILLFHWEIFLLLFEVISSLKLPGDTTIFIDQTLGVSSHFPNYNLSKVFNRYALATLIMFSSSCFPSLFTKEVFFRGTQIVHICSVLEKSHICNFRDF